VRRRWGAGAEGATTDLGWCARVSVLAPHEVRLPLGWLLSERSRHAIELSISSERDPQKQQVARELKQTVGKQ